MDIEFKVSPVQGLIGGSFEVKIIIDGKVHLVGYVDYDSGCIIECPAPRNGKLKVDINLIPAKG